MLQILQRVPEHCNPGATRLCEVVVDNLDRARAARGVGDVHQVLRLEVAVRDAEAVEVRDAGGDLAEDAARLALGQALVARGDPVEELAARAELEGDLDAPVRVEEEVVEARDRRVAGRGCV
jgi:hypothetical protein